MYLYKIKDGIAIFWFLYIYYLLSNCKSIEFVKILLLIGAFLDLGFSLSGLGMVDTDDYYSFDDFCKKISKKEAEPEAEPETE